MDYTSSLDGIQKKLEQHLIEKPVLCRHFTNEKAGSWLMSLRAISRSDLECADNMLMREMAEAFAAYQVQDYDKSIESFQTCGAILCRCINYVLQKKQSETKEQKNEK